MYTAWSERETYLGSPNYLVLSLLSRIVRHT